MRICLVSAFPPSHERVNEYGYHLAHELQRNPFITVTVLADAYDDIEPELPDFEVVRCWRPDSISSCWKLLRTVRDCRPDIVWFNLVLCTFGTKSPLAAFLGLCLPMLVWLAGYSSHVTLHHHVDSRENAGRPPLCSFALRLAIKMLRFADSVTVLLPDESCELMKKYRGENVHFRAPGFASNPAPPDFSMRGNPMQRVLAFGNWGAHNRLETLLEAYDRVAKQVRNVEFVIAGEEHPSAPGYLDSLREQYAARPNIMFTGHLAEQDIPELFKHSSVMIIPYSSAERSTDLARIAAQFGLPILCPDAGEFRDMAQECEFAIEMFDQDNPLSLADHLLTVLNDRARQIETAEQNFSAAVRLTMPPVISRYIRLFDWQEETHIPTISVLTCFVRWTRTHLIGAIAQSFMLSPNSSAHSAARVPRRVHRLSMMPLTQRLQGRQLGKELERIHRQRVA
jgi:glycosyltransferase involved in cell wall biosynthesis